MLAEGTLIADYPNDDFASYGAHERHTVLQAYRVCEEDLPGPG